MLLLLLLLLMVASSLQRWLCPSAAFAGQQSFHTLASGPQVLNDIVVHLLVMHLVNIIIAHPRALVIDYLIEIAQTPRMVEALCASHQVPPPVLGTTAPTALSRLLLLVEMTRGGGICVEEGLMPPQAVGEVRLPLLRARLDITEATSRHCLQGVGVGQVQLTTILIIVKVWVRLVDNRFVVPDAPNADAVMHSGAASSMMAPVRGLAIGEIIKQDHFSEKEHKEITVGSFDLKLSLISKPDKILSSFLVHSTITVRLQMVNYSGYG